MKSSRTRPIIRPLALAAQLLRAGRPHEALAPLREAAAQAPADPAIQHDLGLACLETGLWTEAATAFRAALASNPRYADAYFRLGIALEKLGDLGGAVRAYAHATELMPTLTEAWFRAGALVFTMGHRAEAAGCFRRAAATGPKTGFGRMGAARALLAEDRDPEAETVLRRLLALQQENAMAQDLLGHVCADSGRFDEARELFARAVANAPLMAGSYYDLVRCRKLTRADEDLLPRMQEALRLPGLDTEQGVRVHLALGKASDDLGDYQQAMRHFDDAYEMRRSIASFDSAAFETQIDRMIARFTPEFIVDAKQLTSAEMKPVLIIGMPRSGTTLTEQIISAHPDVVPGGELNFWNERGVAWLASGGAPDPAFFEQAAHAYLGTLHMIGPGAARVSDKMPFNFIWAGLIHVVFPRAIIVHCKRSAIDTALSIHQTHFNPRVAFPTGGAELVTYFNCYRKLTAHWRRVLPKDRFVELDYEALTGAPERAIPQLIAGIGLPWDESCLRPEQNQRVVRTPSKWQARQPIYRGSVERWRRYEPWLGVLGALRT